MATFTRDYSPDDVALLPTDPRDWLAAGHLAYLVRDAVRCLDLGPFMLLSAESRGAPSYSSTMMVSVILYCLCRNVASSRRMAAMCLDDLGCRYLSGGVAPSYRTFIGFRKQHREALSGFLRQTALLCMKAKMTDVTKVFVDGTKLAANASKVKNVPYEQIDRLVDQLDRRIAQIMDNLDRQDADDEANDDSDPSDDRPLPRERDVMVERRRRFLDAKRQLDEEAAQTKQEFESRPKDERRHNPPTGVPRPWIFANGTDPDSRLMRKADRTTVQGYNAQIVVEGRHRVILGGWLSRNATDYAEFIQAIAKVEATTCKRPECIVADTGYFSKHNVNAASSLGVESLIPPRRADYVQLSTSEPELTKSELCAMHPRERMRAVLKTKVGHELYRQRKITVETVFAMIKGCPGSPGFRQFLRRGFKNCEGEWMLACAVHNLKRYFSATRQLTMPKTPTRPIRSNKCEQNGLVMAI